MLGNLMNKIQSHAAVIGQRAATLASDAKKATQQAAFMAKDRMAKMTAGKKHKRRAARKTHKAGRKHRAARKH